MDVTQPKATERDRAHSARGTLYLFTSRATVLAVLPGLGSESGFFAKCSPPCRLL